MSSRGGRRGRGRGGSTNTNGRNAAETVIDEAIVQEQQQPDFAELCKKFATLGGKPFKGTETIVEVQAWIQSCERIFKGLKLEDDMKRYLASWQLQDKALVWWESITREEPEEHFSWARFKEVFEEQYIPAAGKSRLYRSFLDLKQGEMSFEDYANKFNELSQFGPELIDTPRKKNEMFIMGMQKKFHRDMMGHVKESYMDLVDMGYRYETIEKEEQEEEKGAKGSNNNSWKRKKNFQGKKPNTGKSQDKSGIKCYNCQRMGHYSNECKQPKNVKKLKTQGQESTCYNCHKPGHFVKDCPTLQKANVTKVYAIKDEPSTSKKDVKGKSVVKE